MNPLTLYWIGFSLFLISLILNGIFNIKYNEYNFDKTIISYINNDLNSRLIYNLSQKEECDKGEEALILGTWFGSLDRCQCDNAFMSRKCYDYETECNTISGASRNYTKFNGKKICATRKGNTYKELSQSNQIIAKNDQCQGKYNKICGIIDTLERKLCVEHNEECPITNELIEYETRINNYNPVYPENIYNIYLLNDENNNDNTDKIISFIELGENYPCINPEEKVFTTDDRFDKNKCKECSEVSGKKNDDRYENLTKYSTTSRYKLYNDNNLNPFFTYYILIDKTPINLYGRTLYGINLANDINFDRIFDIQNNFKILCKTLRIISIIIGSILIFPIFLLFFALAFKHSGNDIISSNDSGEMERKCCYKRSQVLLNISSYIDGVAATFGNLMAFIFDILILKNVIDLKEILNKVKDNTDIYLKELVGKLIEDISVNYSDNFSYPLANTIIISLSFIIYIIALVLFLLNKREQ